MRLILAWVMLLLWTAGATGQPLPAPEGAPAIVISGDVAQPNAVALDLAALEELGQGSLTTATGWEELSGPQTFTGVPAAELLEALGIGGSEFVITASDGYAVSITREELTSHGALFATALNGAPLDGTKYGPVWLVFDYDGMADEDMRELFKALSVWAIVAIRTG